MGEVARMDKCIGFGVRGQLGRSSEYGQRLYGGHEYGEYSDKYGIYRILTDNGKQIQVQEKFYIPTNPQTEAQQANRATFAAAIAGWQGLTDSQKDVYNQRAKYKPFSGYNLYISKYLLSH